MEPPEIVNYAGVTHRSGRLTLSGAPLLRLPVVTQHAWHGKTVYHDCDNRRYSECRPHGPRLSDRHCNERGQEQESRCRKLYIEACHNQPATLSTRRPTCGQYARRCSRQRHSDSKHPAVCVCIEPRLHNPSPFVTKCLRAACEQSVAGCSSETIAEPFPDNTTPERTLRR